MAVAPHHREDHPFALDTDYKPTCAWPNHARIQWGTDRSFLDMFEKNNWEVPEDLRGREDEPPSAFFEAFADGFMIRSDKETILEAEKDAFAKYQRAISCDHHWRRKFPDSHDSGVAVCVRCKQMDTKALHPTIKLGGWRDPLGFHAVDFLLNRGLRDYEGRKRKRDPSHNRMVAIKARLMGIVLPPLPPEKMTSDEFTQQIPDSYAVACTEAIARWSVTHDVDWPDTYKDMLKRHIGHARHHSARLWESPARREKTSRPVTVPTPNATLAGNADTGPCYTDGSAVYRPVMESFAFTGYWDQGPGGLQPGESVYLRKSDDGQSVIISLPDGRELHWVREPQ